MLRKISVLLLPLALSLVPTANADQIENGLGFNGLALPNGLVEKTDTSKNTHDALINLGRSGLGVSQ